MLCFETRWVRSAFHRLHTVGREWAALWVDFHSTSQLILHIPEAGGAGYHEALTIFFVLCHSAGVALSWSKTAGGDTVAGVGFEILHRSFCLGVSERRAEWFVKWSETVAAPGYIIMDSFEEDLGRIASVAGALEFERPFLAPLDRFLTLHPRGSTRRVPACVFYSELSLITNTATEALQM